MPISPVNSRKQQNLGVNVGAQPRRSISFNGPAKGAQVRGGYVGANQSRMALSKTMVIPSDIRTTEKMNISSTKVVTQVIDIHGVDVTPRPLYHPDPHTGGTAKPNKLFTSQEGSHTSEFVASYSLYQNTLGQFTRAVPMAYGGSQARGLIGAVAAAASSTYTTAHGITGSSTH